MQSNNNNTNVWAGLCGAAMLVAGCAEGAGQQADRWTGGATSMAEGMDTSADSDGGSGDGSGDEGDEGEGDCSNGEICVGGTCIDEECCPNERACGLACCFEGSVCSFGSCVVPGTACTSAEDCSVGEYCEFSLGDTATPPAPGCVGGELLNGLCLPAPPPCNGDEALGPNGLPTCVESCDVAPDSSDLSATLVHEIDGPGYTAPIVIQLDDDDCDGAVTARDIPEIVWNMHTGAAYDDPSNGRLKAVSIIDGEVVERWTYDTVLPLSQIAGGNIDGDPSNGNEVVACASDASVVALRSDGTVLWQAQPGSCGTPYPGNSFLLSVINIADLDKDGSAEIITERMILSGASGAQLASYGAPVHGTVAVSDVTGDGWLDIVSGGQVFDRSGALVATTGINNLIWPAIGDFDGDGVAEIVAANKANRTIAIWHVTDGAAQMIRGAVVLDAVNIPNCPLASAGAVAGGGPPTIGDFDGDGSPDVGIAAGDAYLVLVGHALMDPTASTADTVLWASATNDCSSAQTGSTLFDFDGNGRVEVVYADETRLRIYDGLSGDVLVELPHNSGTINEYPLVADVDADGQADIVALTRGTCGQSACGFLRVFSSATGAWVRTRRVWNQYTYHVTNIEDDGTIPIDELPNWSVPGLNNFRQNKQPGGEFSAADASVSLQAQCFDGYSLRATVRNLGQAPLPTGAVVHFFAGEGPDSPLLGTRQTTTTLYPAQSQVLELELGVAPEVEFVHATVTSEVLDCNPQNDGSEPIAPSCVPVE